MNPFPPLDLPPATLKIRQNERGRMQVYDDLRCRYVTLTAEEWVRQHFIHHLTRDLGFPAALLGNEITIKVGGVSRRCDSVLFAQQGGVPLMIIEYKAPHIPITQETFTQIQSYNSILRAKYLVVSNGMRHYCCHMDYEQHRSYFLSQLPRYQEL